MKVPVVTVDDIAEVQGGLQVTSKRSSLALEVPYLRVANVGRGLLSLDEVKLIRVTPSELSRSRLAPGDLLVVEGHGNKDEIGRVALWNGEIETCVHQNHLIRIRCREGVVVPRFLEAYMNSEVGRRALLRAANTTSGLNTISTGDVRQVPVPLPPLGQQRRISAVLEAAEALRSKRRQALARLEILTQAIFIDLFGDLREYEFVPFGALLASPLRNGISPAKSGTILAKVLTLSAITGAGFKASAVKESTFNRVHVVDKTISTTDFLICRGNGNLALVGRGKYPDRDMPDVAFPDTMIAASCDSSRIAPGYLDHLWGSELVRRQLEASARTTNGTYKVNQTMIGSVLLPLPPIGAQHRFDELRAAIAVQRERSRSEWDKLGILFASLQQRAFREVL